jgi:hypothetical protein
LRLKCGRRTVVGTQLTLLREHEFALRCLTVLAMSYCNKLVSISVAEGAPNRPIDFGRTKNGETNRGTKSLARWSVRWLDRNPQFGQVRRVWVIKLLLDYSNTRHHLTVPPLPSPSRKPMSAPSSPGVDKLTTTHDDLDQSMAVAGSPSPPTQGAPAADDSASTLRAAALLTRKSKRRKPTSDHMSSSSHRPIPTAMVLNYGEEESMSGPGPTAAPPSALGKSTATTMSTMTTGTETATARLTKATTTSEAEDNREEGEISDTDSTPPAATTAQKSKAVPSKKGSKSKATLTTDNKKSTAISKPTSTSASGPAKPTPASEKNSESTSVTPISAPIPSGQPSFVAAPQMISSYVVDADHVRPGLASAYHIITIDNSDR